MKVLVLVLLFILVGLSAAYNINSNGLCIVNSTSINFYVNCYQETANSPTSCGGVGNGVYHCYSGTCTNMIDGNWGSYGTDGSFYVNYTKPVGANNNSVWQVRANQTFTNVSILQSCWSKYSDILRFKVYGGVGNGFYFQCYDGNWNTLASEGPSLDNKMFEEGVWWNLSSSYGGAYDVSMFSEVNGNHYTLNNNNSLNLQVVCPSYGNDNLLLTGNVVSFTVKEQPVVMILSANISNGTSFMRSLVIINASGAVSFYLPEDASIPMYSFHLSDYTKRFSSTKTVFYVKRNVNNTLSIINSQYFDSEQAARVWLYPQIPYEYSIINSYGSFRNYGFQTYVESDAYPATHSIDVVDVNLNEKNRQVFANGLSYSFSSDFTSQSVALNYNKTSGQIDSINFQVFMINQTPYYLLYNTIVYNTQNGILSYAVPNITETYYLYALFTDEGEQLPPFTQTLFIYNQSAVVIDLHPPVNFLGVNPVQFYNIVSFLILLMIGIAATRINAGLIGVGMTGVAAMLSIFGWLTLVPWWLLVTMFIISVWFEFSKGRNVE